MSARVYFLGTLRLDAQRLTLSSGGGLLSPGPKAVATLLALIERAGEVVSKDEILERVWPDRVVEEGNVAQNVYVLRSLLRRHGMGSAIVTVARRGYRFAGPVRQSEERRTGRMRYAAAFAAAAMLSALTLASPSDFQRRAHEPPVHSGGLSAAGARFYALGRYYWNLRTRSALQRGIHYFKEVIVSDRRDARGYAALAESYALMGDYGYGPLSQRRWYAAARAEAAQALQMDRFSAEGHAAMGFASDVSGYRAKAAAEYRKAIALDPTLASAHLWYGTLLLRSGSLKKALTQLRLAAALDPVSVAASAWLSEAAYYSRRYDEAIALARQTLELSPQRPDVNVSMGLAFEASGRYRDAILAFDRYARSDPRDRGEAAALSAYALALAKRPAEAIAELRKARNTPGMAAPEDIAVALVAMGRRSEALRVLQAAGRKRLDPVLAFDARMDAVRGDPAFRAYVRT